MNALRQFVRQVAAAQTATPDAETIVVERLPAVEAAKQVGAILSGPQKKVSAVKRKRQTQVSGQKRGRPITKTGREAELTRKRVRLFRALRRGE